MEKLFKYGITCAFNEVPNVWPITLRGSIEEVCAQAKEIGSDYIVVGRPITAAADPVAAYDKCVNDFLTDNEEM